MDQKTLDKNRYEKLLWVLDFLKKLLHEKPEYTGSLHINFFKGSVSNINKLESFVKTDKNLTDKNNCDNVNYY